MSYKLDAEQRERANALVATIIDDPETAAFELIWLRDNQRYSEQAQNLERENITMRNALEIIERHGPIMGSAGDYRQGQLDILENVSTIASLALANAKDQAQPPAK